MAQITRSTKVSGGTTLQSNTLARAVDVETDVLTLFNAHNNADAGTSKWQVGSFENATSTVVIVNNSTGTNDIIDCRDNGTTVFKIADGGTATHTANAGTNKALISNNGTSTGNIFEAQDNGTAVLSVADAGTTTVTCTNGGSNKTLVVNNGTSTGNILEVQDNGTAALYVADGGKLIVTRTSNQLELGLTNVTTITSTAPSVSRTYTIPDAGADTSFVMGAGTQSIAGIKTFSTQLIAAGTATNDSAAAGIIGERISSTGSASFGSTTVWGDLANIVLTAGDWDISATFFYGSGGATWTAVDMGISVTSGNSGSGLVTGDSNLGASWASSSTTPLSGGLTISDFRASITGSTTYYLKYRASYSGGGPPTASGRLTARRVR